MKPFALITRAKTQSALDRAAQRWGYAMLLWDDRWVVRFIPFKHPRERQRS